MATIINPVKRVEYIAEVSGAPNVTTTDRSGKITPDRVAIHWAVDSDGVHMMHAQIYGKRLKADGSAGVRRDYALFVEGGDDHPDWLAQLISDQTPKEA